MIFLGALENCRYGLLLFWPALLMGLQLSGGFKRNDLKFSAIASMDMRNTFVIATHRPDTSISHNTDIRRLWCPNDLVYVF